jgi:hypothetical protein
MEVCLDAPDVASRAPNAETARHDCKKYVRPSLLDPLLPHEPGLGQCICMPNVVVLYVLNRPVAIIHATRMDQVSLDSWLARVRRHSPRTHVEAQA